MVDLRVVPPAGEPVLEPGAAAYYGTELKRYRQAAGLTQEQLAAEVGYGRSKVSMIEGGRRRPDDRFTHACDRVLDTGGALGRIMPLLKNADAYAAWFKPYTLLEAEATAIDEYQTQTVPGLLQTASYARAVIACGVPAATPEEVERKTAARMARQRVFERDRPPFLRVVVDEVVVRRPIGGRAVLRGQLAHLLAMADRHHVTLSVLPTDSQEHAGLDGSWILLEFAVEPPLLYVEGRGSATMTDQARDVAPARGAFVALCGQALSPRASADLVTAVMREL
ncbi:helix-turn-helix domain-containing protein [Nocardiopsis ansamitocini]|uniref:Transcriptional regulator n=1 Tax=Nocardiopsis ansamitocini TaxID=1670832 RepID=A0A9W6P8L0_9ACTN|nr:helix-turn-helix transcriptional regulator [Nocardiopsis ansamitocini]GLU49585.1 transcriptional regulator [Nocardiopsis ansamitocini]